MSASITLDGDPSPPAQVTIEIDAHPQVSLDGGASSITIERIGTTVEVYNEEPDITDLHAIYLLSSN